MRIARESEHKNSRLSDAEEKERFKSQTREEL